MVREARKDDLKEILELYLYLHEESVPEQCVCVIIPNLTRNIRPYAFLENVVTHADFRGRGLASECLEYARQTAKQCNCYKMMLLTGSSEQKVLDFYKNAGYNSTDKTAFIQWLTI